MKEKVEPELKFCPYCGAQDIKVFKLVPRCMSCRAVFCANFFRFLRKATQ